jgi:hypothetical protein
MQLGLLSVSAEGKLTGLNDGPRGDQRLIAFALIGISIVASISLIWIRFPGEMNADSVSQLNQAIANQYGDWHPPIMALLWHFLLPYGVGTLFVLHVLLYWFGITCCSFYLLLTNRKRSAIACLAFSFTPIFLMLLINVHKDIGMAVALISAFGLICLGEKGYRIGFVAAAPLLVYGLLVRTNAVFAVAPFLNYLVWRAGPRKPALFLLASVLTSVVLIPVCSLVNHRLIGASDERAIQSLQLFDIAGTRSFSHAEDELAACYTPLYWDRLEYRCSALTKMRSQMSGEELLKLWVRTIIEHPLAYLQHRLAHFNSTMYFLVPSHYGDVRVLNLDREGKQVIPLASKMTDIVRYSPIFSPIVWLVAAISILAIFANRSEHSETGLLAATLLTSSILYMSSYFLVGVATDLRYQFWPMIGIYVAAIFLIPEFFKSPEMPRTLERVATAAVLVVVGLTTISRFVEPDFLLSGLK